ncbi:hypothetical protein COT97_02050 [Candidatus Falkowbacteria bacterium CG10_big_fil_rev_8_21_14_0_10_39_11]|uniref:NadR/Ttd14 AAA domain-containing protein n=1 Tax=Candidatus Falkowbacteria bacterium CG10_big_fil_rev_8_21_14_0_10_39_11 TaxID=1974565 RepID=A0A2H0V5A2_9BACT|nr:MAG: hypothetical protein COT97_02050 [Candidatus Falkowbacteria bacterium CG10_big_fil_rev_8_21_14_0_10_39_11]
MNHNKKFVITGCSGSGKTSLVEELKRLGVLTVAEGTREIIESMIREDSPNLPWKNRQQFQMIIVRRRVADFVTASDSHVCIFDRGLPDEIAYYLKDGLKPSEFCLDACEKFRYADMVFFCPPWPEIYTNDGVRQESFSQASHDADLVR